MTEEKLHYRQKRQELTIILRQMNVPRHLFHCLNEAEKFLDKDSSNYSRAMELIGELKIDLQIYNPQVVSQTEPI